MNKTLLARLLLAVLCVSPLSAWARWYDADTGRFLSEDPLLGDILSTKNRLSDPGSLTPWLYSNGSPLKYIDPDGRQTSEPIAPGNGISLTCGFAELTGLSIDFCKDTNQVNSVSIATNQWEARNKLTSSAAAVSLYTGGPQTLFLGLTLGYGLDVAQQTYADPNHIKTIEQVDHLGALERGANMCAIPPALRLASNAGRLGKIAAAGTAIYFSGLGIGEGAAQISAAYQQGANERYLYGTSLILLSATGAKVAHDEASLGIPFSKLPSWMFADVELASQAMSFPGGPPPLRINFRIAEYRRAMMVLAQERVRLNLPRAGAAGDEYTLAMLEINGKPYIGREAEIPIADRAAFLDLMKDAASTKGANGTAGAFVDHAEGSVFYQAFMKNAQGRSAKLFIDRELCPYCLRSISNARHILELDEVVVYDSKYPEGRIFPLR